MVHVISITRTYYFIIRFSNYTYQLASLNVDVLAAKTEAF